MPRIGVSDAKKRRSLRGTASPARIAADRSRPSSSNFVFPGSTPVMPASVGKRSIADMMLSKRVPPSSSAGQRITATTRIPPSKVSPFPPRSGTLSAPPVA